MSESKDTGRRPALPANSAAPALRRVMKELRTLHAGLRQCGRAYRAIHAPVPPALCELINQSNQRLAILRKLDDATRARAIHLWHTTALGFDGAVLRATREYLEEEDWELKLRCLGDRIRGQVERLQAETGMPREDCLRVAMGDRRPLIDHETKRLCEEAGCDR